jgi:hypothetical protein
VSSRKWDELSSQQRQRIVTAMRRDPARRNISEADAGRRWDSMTPEQRRAAARQARRRRSTTSAPA